MPHILPEGAVPIDAEQLLEACRREGARRVLAFDEYGESLWPRTDWLALHVLPDSLGTQVVAEPLTALDPEPWSTVAESAPLAADGLTALTLCCLEEQLQWPSRLWLLPPRGCARPPMLLADGLRGGWMPPAASAAGLGAPRLAAPASWGGHSWLWVALRTLEERLCRRNPERKPRHGCHSA